MANKNDPQPEQPIYDAPGKSERSRPHGGTGSPSDDAPGQVKKDEEQSDQPPAPNQDLPDEPPAPNQDLPA